MKNYQKGFTLIELLVVVFIIGVIVSGITLAIGFFGFSFGCTQQEAAFSMEQQIHNLYDPVDDIRISCAKEDSDSNGRLRCVGSYIPIVNDNPQSRKTISWECNEDNCQEID